MFDIAGFSKTVVLCVGDVMLDRFIVGEVKRISPESPVPVLNIAHTKDVPGGAANVGRNVCSLEGACILVGVIGDDEAGRKIAALLGESESIVADLVCLPDRLTAEKTRFVAQGQHLLRADREDSAPISAAVETIIVEKVARHIGHCHALVLSDYAKGVLTDRVLADCIGLARRHGVPVVVDPKSPSFSRYDGATIITPNIAETAAAVGVVATNDALAESAGHAALEQAAVDAILITRAGQGMTLVDRQAGVVHLPTSAREVFDVVGAGDTVVAALALALGAGWPMRQGASLANVAAGLVVGKRGTAVVSQSELLEELGRISLEETGQSSIKSSGVKALLGRRKTWEKERLTVGFTNGCFDILHIGHLRTLEFARRHCDRLVVGLNSDASVARLKGPSRPINGVEDRVRMLSALTCVDAVIVFEEDTPAAIIEALQPDLLVKGADYRAEEIVGASTVLARGGKVLTCPLVPDRSTTKIIEKATLS